MTSPISHVVVPTLFTKGSYFSPSKQGKELMLILMLMVIYSTIAYTMIIPCYLVVP